MNKFLLRNSSAPKEPFPTSNLEEFWSLTRKFHGSGLTLHVYTIKLRDPSAIQDDPKVNKIVYILRGPNKDLTLRELSLSILEARTPPPHFVPKLNSRIYIRVLHCHKMS